MNNRSVYRSLAIAVLVVAGAAAIAIAAYNAGMAQGLAQNAPAITALPPGTPFVYAWRPWGVGFFPFFPFFFLLLVFFAIRGLFWRGPWRGGAFNAAVPPAFDEWHRRAHGGQVPVEPNAGSRT